MNGYLRTLLLKYVCYVKSFLATVFHIIRSFPFLAPPKGIRIIEMRAIYLLGPSVMSLVALMTDIWYGNVNRWEFPWISLVI